MRFKRLLDKLGIEVVESDRPLSQLFAWGGILETKSYKCHICRASFSDTKNLESHYRNICGRGSV